MCPIGLAKVPNRASEGARSVPDLLNKVPDQFIQVPDQSHKVPDPYYEVPVWTS